MRSILLLLGLLLLLQGCGSDPPAIRIMTYNIRHAMGMNGVVVEANIAEVIKAANPDIVILNEVDQGTLRSMSHFQADTLASMVGLDSRFGRSIDYDGGLYGNALLSRFPILEFEVFDLSTHPLLEGRTVFQSLILVGADTLSLLGTHLGLLEEEQLAQIRRILEIVQGRPHTVLAGDLNFTPETQQYELISKVFRDGIRELVAVPEFTFPADKTRRRIDYIFISSDIEPVMVTDQYHRLAYSASDHLPQILDIRLK